jgi:hypothetical protein
VVEFHVVELWADWSNAEQDRCPADSPAGLGFVDTIRPTSIIQQGQQKNQTPLYPPQLKEEYDQSGKTLSSAELLEGLTVKGPESISAGDWSLVVDLGGRGLVFQVCVSCFFLSVLLGTCT